MKWSFGEINSKDWDEFEKSHSDQHFFQGVQRLKKRTAMGYQSHILGVREGGKIVAGGVLLGRGGEFWMAYGPLIDWDDLALLRFLLQNTLDFSREKRFVKLEIFPPLLLSTRDSRGRILKSWPREKLIDLFAEFSFKYQGETVDYQMKAGRWAFTKDLTGLKTVDELRSTYRKTLRARLRQTDGKVTIGELTREELPTLIGLIDESDTRNSVAGRELEYYRYIYNAFGQDVKFLVAYKSADRTPIAGAIFIYHGSEVASYLSGMNRQFRDLNGRAWLQDYVMSQALKQGITRVNFFWIEGRFENNHLLEFKSGFGGVVEEYIGGFEKVLRPVKYTEKILLRKVKSLARRILTIPSRLRHRN